MIFSSSVFILLALPLFLAAYYVTPLRHRSLCILLGSYVFYGWWRLDFLALLVGLSAFSYVLSKRIVAAEDGRHRKRLLIVGVAVNVITLGYFKYFNFGVDAMNDALAMLDIAPLSLWHVILPIGVSFFIFHCISYLVDVYRGDAEVAPRFTDFAAFIALFPHLIAGPVLRYKDLAWQFGHRTHTLDKFNEGAIRFTMGFAKKVLLADSIAPLADRMFEVSNPGFVESWLGVLAYTAQLYFDFSGYSDMAVGLALMMGFRFIENFNQPYTSRSITEFWRRWHISLSTWLRDYLYIPLGGNRKGTLRTYINLFLTMLLGGLWHGANWTFLLWGGWHGALLALERYLGAKRASPYPRMIAWPFTFLCVLLGWVLFRAHDLHGAWAIYRGMLGLNGYGMSADTAWATTPFELAMVVAAYGVISVSPFLVRRDFNPTALQPTWAHRISPALQVGVVALLLFTLTKMIAQSYSPFLYFQF